MPVPELEILGLFDSIGMTHLANRHTIRTENDYGSYFFELRSDKGLTEAHCVLRPTDMTLSEFSIRFSVISPKTVIDQTFHLFERLNVIKPIDIYDSEIRNHIKRKLRNEGKVDRWFKGLEGTAEEDKINKMCYIPIDSNVFMQNKLGIAKRELVCKNDSGEIIEGGPATSILIRKKGLFDKYIGWITKEL